MEKGVSRRGKSKSTRAWAGEDHGSSDEAVRGAPGAMTSHAPERFKESNGIKTRGNNGS